jgi:hypothetical protein
LVAKANAKPAVEDKIADNGMIFAAGIAQHIDSGKPIPERNLLIFKSIP